MCIYTHIDVYTHTHTHTYSLVAQMGKIGLKYSKSGFHPWVGKIPRIKECQPTPVFLPGEPHGQRSLVGYSPWDLKGSGRTEQLTHTHTHALLIHFCAVEADPTLYSN